ncbi:hypothetical protein M5K25_002621 [Dendrobium thyrsiflorum]|uniref:Uncharacterized protein n=1 Tax=Dendrobium thyrsiflorum TaxID=117978 RepID=A0ABD0VMW4_DENTH
MGDPELDSGFEFDEDGRTDILGSLFFDVFFGADETADEYLDRILYRLSLAIEEHITPGRWIIIGHPPPPLTPAIFPSPRILSATVLVWAGKGVGWEKPAADCYSSVLWFPGYCLFGSLALPMEYLFGFPCFVQNLPVGIPCFCRGLPVQLLVGFWSSLAVPSVYCMGVGTLVACLLGPFTWDDFWTSSFNSWLVFSVLVVAWAVRFLCLEPFGSCSVPIPGSYCGLAVRFLCLAPPWSQPSMSRIPKEKFPATNWVPTHAYSSSFNSWLGFSVPVVAWAVRFLCLAHPWIRISTMPLPKEDRTEDKPLIESAIESKYRRRRGGETIFL